MICLNGVALSTVDVPLTKTVYRHVEARDFQLAYAVACLGVTQVNGCFRNGAIGVDLACLCGVVGPMVETAVLPAMW